MDQAKRLINAILRPAGLTVTRISTLASPPARYAFEIDETFRGVFREGVSASGSTHDPNKIHKRMYNAVQFLRHTRDLCGAVAECGAFQGLSSFVFCEFIRLDAPDFKGEGYHVFDSFSGLSTPTAPDHPVNPAAGAGAPTYRRAGAFQATLETVRNTLRDYPAIAYHPGWIPDSLAGVPDRQYRFVHLDLDLYEPTKGALAYFYPRMIQGGIIVVDEYGVLRWPGARLAVDEFCREHGVTPAVSLTTGNGALIKK